MSAPTKKRMPARDRGFRAVLLSRTRRQQRALKRAADDPCAVELAAIALREARNVPGVGDPSPWGDATTAARDAYRREARAALAGAAGRNQNDKEGR